VLLLYNFVANSIHTKNFVADFFQEKCNFRWKRAILRFRDPFGGGLGTMYGRKAMYDVCLRLTGKRIVDFLLVIIEHFCYMLWLRCYERISIENRRFCRNVFSLAKISGI